MTSESITIVVVVGIVAVFTLKVIRMLIVKPPRRENLSEDELQIIKRLDAGLEAMERRIEALETILKDATLRH